MTCYHPLRALLSREKNPETGKQKITFNPLEAINEHHILNLPCGQCIGCRLERSRQWALRCLHEAQLHEQNCFITLTYATEKLPDDYSVHVRAWQLFMKKLRKSLGGRKIRSFACGEYGDLNLRPHYHAIIFNHDFPDKRLWSTDRHGNKLYTSEKLKKLWPYGHSTLGDVTFESAAYVARYVMKKITGDNAPAHYTRVHPVSQKICRVQPEFVTQSRRPGLGAPWLARYKDDVYPHDFIIARGMKMQPPRFYDQKLSEGEITEIKRLRKQRGARHKIDNTPERLRTRETIKKARVQLLKRNLKDDQQ